MTIVELATIIGSHLVLGVSKQWTCHLRDVEEKDGPILTSRSGIGHTAREAIVDYVGFIRGKHIVIYSGNKDMRKEFDVPDTLEAGDLQ
jgi:hypothetical protein